jgi:hypothetical protein
VSLHFLQQLRGILKKAKGDGLTLSNPAIFLFSEKNSAGDSAQASNIVGQRKNSLANCTITIIIHTTFLLRNTQISLLPLPVGCNGRQHAKSQHYIIEFSIVMFSISHIATLGNFHLRQFPRQCENSIIIQPSL